MDDSKLSTDEILHLLTIAPLFDMFNPPVQTTDGEVINSKWIYDKYELTYKRRIWAHKEGE